MRKEREKLEFKSNGKERKGKMGPYIICAMVGLRVKRQLTRKRMAQRIVRKSTKLVRKTSGCN